MLWRASAARFLLCSTTGRRTWSLGNRPVPRRRQGYWAVQALPGVPTLAGVFVAEIGDVYRFERPDQLCSRAGAAQDSCMIEISRSKLLEVVKEPQSVNDLRQYFVPAVAGGLPAFSGGRFEGLSNGGDREEVRDGLMPDDLVAVQLLSVVVPRPVVLELLEGDVGREVSTCLGDIPTNVEIGTEAAAPLLAEDGPAERAWKLLTEQDGVGWVTAGKLLARKRPKLIPVYDRVVSCAYGRPRRAWSWLHDQFAAESGELATTLNEVAEQAGVPAAVSALRVLDVIIWMRHRDAHLERRCPRAEF
jgi:Family of unknown function (DUF6308)